MALGRVESGAEGEHWEECKNLWEDIDLGENSWERAVCVCGGRAVEGRSVGGGALEEQREESSGEGWGEGGGSGEEWGGRGESSGR